METINGEVLAGGTRRRLSRAEADRIVADYGRSGQTQESFARERGLKVGTLRNWLYRSRAEGPGSLREVVVKAEPKKESGAAVVVVRTSRGVEVELPLCAGHGWIERMVRELARS